MMNEQNDLKTEAIVAASASIRLGQNLGLVALEALMNGLDEASFLRAARDTYRTIETALGNAAAAVQASMGKELDEAEGPASGVPEEAAPAVESSEEVTSPYGPK